MASSEPIVVRFSDEDRALIQQLIDTVKAKDADGPEDGSKRLVENFPPPPVVDENAFYYYD